MLVGHRLGGLGEDLRRRLVARPASGDLGGDQQQVAGLLAQLALAAGPKAWIVSPSVSSTAMSTASSEVPVMNPRIRMVRLTATARPG
jgi:hypothetical protein